MDERIDTSEQMDSLLTQLRNGKYDHLIAWDDTRIARDAFYWVVLWNAESGGYKRIYKEDVDEDSLTFRVMRAVETVIKKKDIKKSRETLDRKRENGEPLELAPYGFTRSEDKTRLILDEDTFDDVEIAFKLRTNGASYTDINKGTGIARSTHSRIFNEKRELYEMHLEGDTDN